MKVLNAPNCMEIYKDLEHYVSFGEWPDRSQPDWFIDLSEVIFKKTNKEVTTNNVLTAAYRQCCQDFNGIIARQNVIIKNQEKKINSQNVDCSMVWHNDV